MVKSYSFTSFINLAFDLFFMTLVPTPQCTIHVVNPECFIGEDVNCHAGPALRSMRPQAIFINVALGTSSLCVWKKKIYRYCLKWGPFFGKIFGGPMQGLMTPPLRAGSAAMHEILGGKMQLWNDWNSMHQCEGNLSSNLLGISPLLCVSTLVIKIFVVCYILFHSLVF